MKSRLRGGGFLLVALLTAAVALTGCGGSADSPGASRADRAEAPAEGNADGDAKRRDPDAGEPPKAVIHTGSLHLRVSDVAKAADEAIEIARDAEGTVGQDKRASRDRFDEAKLTLRIPAAKFADAMKAFTKLGKELERDITAEDVSEAVLDLDGRIAGKRASVKRVRALLDTAESLDEISRIERELTTRESELASLEAQKRQLANRVDYSSVTITFSSKERPAPPPEEKTQVGFGTGLASGWYAFRVATQVILTIVGALLPFAIAFAVPAFGLWWLLRRRKRARQAVVAQPTGDAGR
ncbi:MAG: DUF4349 domain-containing protein [Micromonosporaceae bacterium]